MKDKISLSIELEADSLSGKLRIHNHSKTDVILWEPGSRWGDCALSFEIDTAVGPVKCEKRDEIYTINVPSTFTIPPGKDYVIPFRLDDGSWTNGGPRKKTMTQLTAIYEIVPTPEAKKFKVLSGSIMASRSLVK